MAKQNKSESYDLSVNQVAPIKISILLDIVVRVRQEEYSSPIKLNLPQSDSGLGGSGCPDNKFTYKFEKENASVLSLSVGEYHINNPNDSGEFTTCIHDAGPVPKITVTCFGKVDNVGGRVALTLKFLGKDVFSTPAELKIQNGGLLGLFSEPNLPK